jgi:hypothetical protein
MAEALVLEIGGAFAGRTHVLADALHGHVVAHAGAALLVGQGFGRLLAKKANSAKKMKPQVKGQ